MMTLQPPTFRKSKFTIFIYLSVSVKTFSVQKEIAGRKAAASWPENCAARKFSFQWIAGRFITSNYVSKPKRSNLGLESEVRSLKKTSASPPPSTAWILFTWHEFKPSEQFSTSGRLKKNFQRFSLIFSIASLRRLLIRLVSKYFKSVPDTRRWSS